jgi:hypothetical protein
MTEQENVQETDFLEECAGQGFDNISSDDCQIPFLRILQPQSTQCQRDGDDYIEGAEPGMFYNTLTNKVYDKALKVIPIYFDKVWLEWKPNRGGFVGRHMPNSFVPDKSNFSEWKNEVNNIITEHFNFYCILADYPEEGILVLSLAGSSITHAKNWNSQISYVRLPSGNTAAYYSSVWELKTAFNKNDKGSWHAIGAKKTNVRRLRYITKDELTKFVKPALELTGSMKLDYKQIETTIKNETDLLTEETIDY